jgi:preprotein translocase subunit SecD
VKKKFLWRISIIAVAAVLSVIFFLPTLPVRSALPDWLNKFGITLGLDLQGGVHLVYEVKVDKAIEVDLDETIRDLKRTFKEEKIDAEFKRDGTKILVITENKDFKKLMEEETAGLIYKDTNDLTSIYELDPDEIKEIKRSAVDKAIEKIRNRVDKFGLKEPDIHRSGEFEIVIQLPGVKDADKAIKDIGRTAILEFKLADDENPVQAQLPRQILPGEEKNILDEFSSKIPEDDEILFEPQFDKETKKIVSKMPLLIKKEVLMRGEAIKRARPQIDTYSNSWIVQLEFKPEGAKQFAELTGNNVGKRLAIVLDNTVYSAPNIKQKIEGGSAIIEGVFDVDEVKRLAAIISEGALPAPLEMQQNVTVGPSLGSDSINAGVKAAIIGAILVVVFMVVYYKLSGLIADFALILNIVCLVGVLSAFNATLTLPGIAGVILAIGMAVDSNVLMFERIREELRVGKTPRAAIDSGYDKAFWTIFDSHVTTLITAVVLFQFGTGPIKGFAVTLGWGVFINLFTALIGTKTIFDLLTTKREVKELSI